MLILLGVESVRNIDFITQMVYGRIIDPTFLLIFFFLSAYGQKAKRFNYKNQERKISSTGKAVKKCYTSISLDNYTSYFSP
jgi:hypothetical protein